MTAPRTGSTIDSLWQELGILKDVEKLAMARHSRCIGLIGGLGIGATILYYQELAKAHAARGRALDLCILHADVARVLGLIKAGDVAALTDYLAAFAERLHAAGAEMVALTGVAPHFCAPELARRAPVPLIDLVTEIGAAVRQAGYRRVSLFGTRFAMESRLFGRLADVEVVLPRPEELTQIHDAYVGIVNRGAGDAATLDLITEIAQRQIARDQVDAIVFAGTELSLLFLETPPPFPHIDGTKVHLDAIMRAVG
jgi:aspartate racemase